MKTVQQIAMEIVAREGGYVNDPDDPGGATNFGVTIHTMRRLGLDLDGDGDIDLAVASTEAGLYLYENDGSGQFSRLALDPAAQAELAAARQRVATPQHRRRCGLGTGEHAGDRRARRKLDEDESQTYAAEEEEIRDELDDVDGGGGAAVVVELEPVVTWVANQSRVQDQWCDGRVVANVGHLGCSMSGERS